MNFICPEIQLSPNDMENDLFITDERKLDLIENTDGKFVPFMKMNNESKNIEMIYYQKTEALRYLDQWAFDSTFRTIASLAADIGITITKANFTDTNNFRWFFQKATELRSSFWLTIFTDGDDGIIFALPKRATGSKFRGLIETEQLIRRYENFKINLAYFGDVDADYYVNGDVDVTIPELIDSTYKTYQLNKMLALSDMITFTASFKADPLDYVQLTKSSKMYILISKQKSEIEGDFIYTAVLEKDDSFSFSGGDIVPVYPLHTDGGVMTGILKFNNNVRLYFGTSSPFYIVHTGTAAFISNWTGDLIISKAGGTPLIKLPQSGAIEINPNGTDVDFQIKGTTDDNLIYADASTDSVGFGASTHSFTLEETPRPQKVYIEGNGEVYSGLTLSNDNDDRSIFLNFIRSRNGSVIVENNDVLGQMTFNGWDGVNYNQGAYFIGAVDGAVEEEIVPTRLEFWTTETNDPMLRMTIKANGFIGIGAIPTLPFDVLAKSGHTSIGGFAIKLTNKTGSNTIKGQLVRTSFPAGSDTDLAFETAIANDENVIGVVLDNGVADGSEAWIVVSGIADVLMDPDGSTRGDRIISSGFPGFAKVWNVGGSTTIHFQEVGHCLETTPPVGLALCVLHFN